MEASLSATWLIWRGTTTPSSSEIRHEGAEGPIHMLAKMSNRKLGGILLQRQVIFRTLMLHLVLQPNLQVLFHEECLHVEEMKRGDKRGGEGNAITSAFLRQTFRLCFPE